MNNKEVNEHASKHNDKRNKYLIFSLQEEQYGIPLSEVKEVIGMTDNLTPVPHTPKFFRGLINLRGKIISVLDLRTKLALPSEEYVPKKTTIIITEVSDFTIGVIVDGVNEVVGFEPSEIEKNIDIQSKVSRDFIIGVAKRASLILLLDLEKTLSVNEMGLLRQTLKAA